MNKISTDGREGRRERGAGRGRGSRTARTCAKSALMCVLDCDEIQFTPSPSFTSSSAQLPFMGLNDFVLTIYKCDDWAYTKFCTHNMAPE